MLEWLLFNTVIPLLPAPLVWWFSKMTKTRKKRIFEVIKDGQLCFYCTVTGAVLLKDLLPPNGPGLNLLLFGGLLLILIGSAGSYFVAVVLNDDIEEKGLGWFSISMVVLTTALVLSVRATEGLL